MGLKQKGVVIQLNLFSASPSGVLILFPLKGYVFNFTVSVTRNINNWMYQVKYFVRRNIRVWTL